MDYMEEGVEEKKGWGRLDDLDGEYEICICSQKGVYEVECYTMKPFHILSHVLLLHSDR